jgi:hypothetical protein
MEAPLLKEKEAPFRARVKMFTAARGAQYSN